MTNKERNRQIWRLAQKGCHSKMHGAKTRLAARVWYVAPFGEIVTEPLTVLWVPGHKLIMLGGPLEKSRMIVHKAIEDHGATWIKELDGIKGIAITDPHWDGKHTFKCQDCDAAHDVDETMAPLLYHRFENQAHTAVN